ncbi:hypothetical protein [Cellulosilyticum ruminicola]|uniref:hypothetical protein n=1 Tax=Cellulosilyticum ruminicola TaxID=425254 RepID=UPI0006CF791E|nr:hypothetical protein [Cellulosilyticum ruminicola]
MHNVDITQNKFRVVLILVISLILQMFAGISTYAEDVGGDIITIANMDVIMQQIELRNKEKFL